MANFSVRVKEDTCIGCAVCAQICPTDVFKIVMKKLGEYERLVSVVQREEACIGCMACVYNCPTDSIEVTKKGSEEKETRENEAIA